MEKHWHRLKGPRLPLQALEFLLWSSGMGCLGKQRGVLSSAWCLLPLSRYELETVPKTPTVKAGLTGHVKAAPEQGWATGDGSGKKGKGAAGCWQGAVGFPSSASGGG